MLRDSYEFELSFVSQAGSMPPELVFSIDTKHFPELRERLELDADRISDYAQKYLKQEPVDFFFSEPDLFGKIKFGYGGCGYVVSGDLETSFHIQLRPVDYFSPLSLTLSLLSMALSAPFEKEESKSNKTQMIQIDCDADYKREAGWNHLTSGWVHRSVTDWIKKYVELELAKELGHEKRTSVKVPTEVVDAMYEALAASRGGDVKKETDLCHGLLNSDGRFYLTCPGDACELSIYPDSLWGTDESTQFSCHNLDSSCQQITLVAGLAKLLELVRTKEL